MQTQKQEYPYVIVWREPIWMMAAKLMLDENHLLKLPLEDVKHLLSEFRRLAQGIEIEFGLGDGKGTNVTFWRLDDKIFMKVNDQPQQEVSLESLQSMIAELEESIAMREEPQLE